VRFGYASEIPRDHPSLVSGVVEADGIRADACVEPRLAEFADVAADRLATDSEGAFPEVQAWRRAFAQMGLKPTQYRCASESLLRRYRREGALPRIHPLIDLCNAVSLAFAIPVAVFDVERIAGRLEVRYASGSEEYLAFSGDVEHPRAGEVVFADEVGRAHARRWTNRQSAYSAVRDETRSALIVAEALHDTAAADIARLTATLTEAIQEGWSTDAEANVLHGGRTPGTVPRRSA
jgi:DNA/RNA-binding domain of Phe-tRNA-synthetase-like protein